MFVGELEGLNQSESLVNWSTYWQVIDGNLTKVLLLIDDEKTSVGDTLIFLEDAIFAWNGMVSICQEWNVHFSKTPLFTWTKWLNWLSVEQATTSQPMFLNSSTLSENAIISVGHTNVLKIFKEISLLVIWISIRFKLTNPMDRRKEPSICPCSRSMRLLWIVHQQQQRPWRMVLARRFESQTF